MSRIVQQFKGGIHNGELVFENEAGYKARIKELEGKTVNIVVKRFRHSRTGQQNKYYWKYLRIIADDTGDNSNSLHEAFKRMFLPPIFKYVKALKKNVKIPTSTRNLSTKDMSHYIKEIEKITGILAPDIRDLA